VARAKDTTQKPGIAWLFHLFYFSSTGLLAAALGSGLGVGWGGIIMLLLSLPSLALMPWIWERWHGKTVAVHGFAIPLLVFSWIGVIAHVDALPLLWAYSTLPEVAARDLAQHPQPLVLRVRDGKVQTRYAYVHSSRTYQGRQSTPTFTQTCVAPVTPTDWTPEQPIPLWAVCPDSPSECRQCRDWRTPNSDLIPPLTWGESSAREAARQAAQRQGLHLSDPVRIAVWVRSASDALLSHVLVAVASIWGMYLLWAMCAIIYRWWR
jgi:hypothetical protein